MPKILVNLIDMAGHQAALPLPSNKLLTNLVPAIVTLLDLTETDTQGNPLRYQLFSPRLQRVLATSGTLYSNGVMQEDTLRLVPAATSGYLEFELLDEPSPGARLPLPNQSRISLGRGSENDIVIRHAAVSRRHGELIWQDGLHIYRDLNSANGSYINNQIVTEPMPISPGSILGLGETVRLVYQEAVPLVDKDGQMGMGLPASVLDSRMSTSLNPLPRGIVFVSYSQEQLSLVKTLIGSLRNANFHIFWDQEIPPGSNAPAAIASAIKLADVLLAILTPESVITPTLLDQWNEFVLLRKPIVPVVYAPCDVPALFDEYDHIEFHGDFKRMVDEVIAIITKSIR